MTPTVGDVMTRCPVSVPLDAPFETIAAILTHERISAVPVVDAAGAPAGAGVRRLFVTERGRLAGVLSRRDLLKTYVVEDDMRDGVRRALLAVLPGDRGAPSVSVRDGVVLPLGRVEWRSTKAAVDDRPHRHLVRSGR